MLRWLSSCALLFVLFPASAQVARAQEVPPTIRVQVRSLDAVIDNLKLLVSLAGREEIAKQVEGLIKTKIGNKGLEGIDPARPFGAYSRFGKDLNDVSGVVMIPIADEGAFLGLLENLNARAEKNDKTGIYTVKIPAPVAISFRFANKYAYFTALNLDAIEPKSLLTPERVFQADAKAAIAASLRLDQLPDALKFIAKAQFEQGVQDAQDKKVPGETPAQKAFRLQVARQIVEDVSSVISDGQELNIDFNIDRVSREMAATFSLTAQGKTPLARRIAELNKGKNLFGSLRSTGAAVQGSVTLVMPEALQKTFAGVLDEARTKILNDARDPGKKKQAEELLNALAPSFKAGELDAALSFQGPGKDKRYSVVAAVKIKEGDQLNKVFRDLVEETTKQIPATEKAKIQLDAETVAGAKVHRFDLGSHYDNKIRDIFGDSPAYIAIRNDAVFYAIGPDAQAILKSALASKGDAGTSPLTVEVSLARLAPLMAKSGAQAEKLQTLFPAGEDGTVRFTIEGGDTLKVRLTTRLSVVQFLGAVANLRQAKGFPD